MNQVPYYVSLFSEQPKFLNPFQTCPECGPSALSPDTPASSPALIPALSPDTLTHCLSQSGEPLMNPHISSMISQFPSKFSFQKTKAFLFYFFTTYFSFVT